MSAADNWTRDADGNFVDWTQPPYKVGGILNLLLPGEDDSASGMDAVISKRNREYIMILRKRRNQARRERAAQRSNALAAGRRR